MYTQESLLPGIMMALKPYCKRNAKPKYSGSLGSLSSLPQLCGKTTAFIGLKSDLWFKYLVASSGKTLSPLPKIITPCAPIINLTKHRQCFSILLHHWNIHVHHHETSLALKDLDDLAVCKRRYTGNRYQ